MESFSYSIIGSRPCNVGIVWLKEKKNPKVVRVFLIAKKYNAHKRILRILPGAKRGENNKIDSSAKRIKLYLRGNNISLGLTSLKKDLCSEFQWSVSIAARRIPFGRVTTYKTLARHVGSNSARAIGNALSKNPFPIIIPCHRIVGSDRGVRGFQSGKNLKRVLLELEGIEFDKKGRIPKEFFI
jgi:methylated-DNA-[protein]-cysteine S-methyltransferase